MLFQYDGLIAAVVTPTKADGSVNVDAIPDYITFLINQNVHAVFVNGTAGEWPSFSVDERKLIAEQWIKHGQNKLKKIIIHCGAQSITDAISLVKHAASIGADGISCIPPSIFKNFNEESLADYLKAVADHAPDVPFIYYHYPILTNVQVNFKTFLPLLDEKIKTFAGFKLTTPNLADVAICVDYAKKRPLALMYGWDMQLHSAVLMGLTSAIGGFYNFLGKEFNTILNSSATDDFIKAKELQMKIAVDISELFLTYGGSVFKTLTTLFSGIDMGQPRLPVKPFHDKDILQIKSYMEERGYILKC